MLVEINLVATTLLSPVVRLFDSSSVHKRAFVLGELDMISLKQLGNLINPLAV